MEIEDATTKRPRTRGSGCTGDGADRLSALPGTALS
jgi:hypothetical protein